MPSARHALLQLINPIQDEDDPWRIEKITPRFYNASDIKSALGSDKLYYAIYPKFLQAILLKIGTTKAFLLFGIERGRRGNTDPQL